MRGHVVQLARAVAARGEDFVVAHHDGANRNLAARAGCFGLLKRQLHEACLVAAHLASLRSL
jgi:hypothetical protein